MFKFGIFSWFSYVDIEQWFIRKQDWIRVRSSVVNTTQTNNFKTIWVKSWESSNGHLMLTCCYPHHDGLRYSFKKFNFPEQVNEQKSNSHTHICVHAWWVIVLRYLIDVLEKRMFSAKIVYIKAYRMKSRV